MTTRPLRERAIALMKDGRSADELRVLFVAEGADPQEVHAVLGELVTLQRQASALDPARLRAEADWMFACGAAVDDVVTHFVRTGVAEANARPEAQRLFAAFQSKRPCQRCGMPTPLTELVFDLTGFSICSTCNLRDEINRSEQRGVARDLESIGMLGGVGGMVIASAMASAADASGGRTTSPVCARCRQPSGVRVITLLPEVRARLDPSWQWVCTLCWQRIA